MQVNVVTAEHVALAARVAARRLENGGPYRSEPIDSKARELAAEALREFADYVVMDTADLEAKLSAHHWEW